MCRKFIYLASFALAVGTAFGLAGSALAENIIKRVKLRLLKITNLRSWKDQELLRLGLVGTSSMMTYRGKVYVTTPKSGIRELHLFMSILMRMEVP